MTLCVRSQVQDSWDAHDIYSMVRNKILQSYPLGNIRKARQVSTIQRIQEKAKAEAHMPVPLHTHCFHKDASTQPS